MPFDGQNFEANADFTTLFRERRERAAELWRGVPTEAFYMGAWHCATKACALGWLANRRHDGWKWGWAKSAENFGVALFPIWSETKKQGSGGSAAIYFGLTHEDARRCFAIGEITEEMEKLTPDDVAKTLLALEYVTPDAKHAVGLLR
jgi:hypothetical protein